MDKSMPECLCRPERVANHFTYIGFFLISPKDSYLLLMLLVLDWVQSYLKCKRTTLYNQLHMQVILFKKHGCNYGVTELQALGVVWAVKHFRSYLYGHRYDVCTDHEALK